MMDCMHPACIIGLPARSDNPNRDCFARKCSSCGMTHPYAAGWNIAQYRPGECLAALAAENTDLQSELERHKTVVDAAEVLREAMTRLARGPGGSAYLHLERCTKGEDCLEPCCIASHALKKFIALAALAPKRP